MTIDFTPEARSKAAHDAAFEEWCRIMYKCESDDPDIRAKLRERWDERDDITVTGCAALVVDAALNALGMATCEGRDRE